MFPEIYLLPSLSDKASSSVAHRTSLCSTSHRVPHSVIVSWSLSNPFDVSASFDKFPSDACSVKKHESGLVLSTQSNFSDF